MSQTTASNTTAATALGVLGIVLYLGVGFIFLTSGLVVPFPWLAVLWAIWIVGVYPLVKTFQSRRAWTPLIPLAAIAFWWVYLSMGEALLGWTP